jgi:uncharacterized membrane protein (DUF485 family)
MSDIFILYVAFSYLFMAGVSWSDIYGDKVRRAVHVVLAPFLFPFVLGVIFVEDNQ